MLLYRLLSKCGDTPSYRLQFKERKYRSVTMITRASTISPTSGTTSDLIESMKTVGFPAANQAFPSKPTFGLGYPLRPENRRIDHVVFYKGALSGFQLIRRSNAICIVNLPVETKPPGTTRSEDEFSTSIQVMNDNRTENKQTKCESDYNGTERDLSDSKCEQAILHELCN